MSSVQIELNMQFVEGNIYLNYIEMTKFQINHLKNRSSSTIECPKMRLFTEQWLSRRQLKSWNTDIFFSYLLTPLFARSLAPANRWTCCYIHIPPDNGDVIITHRLTFVIEVFCWRYTHIDSTQILM